MIPAVYRVQVFFSPLQKNYESNKDRLSCRNEAPGNSELKAVQNRTAEYIYKMIFFIANPAVYMKSKGK